MKKVVKLLLVFTGLVVLSCPIFAQDDQLAKVIEKALADGERTAVRDASGKITQMELEYFGPKQVLEFGYEDDILSSVTLGDGTKMTILRNEKGGIEGFSFPDGKKAMFLWMKGANFDFSFPVGLKIITPDGKEKILRLSKDSSPIEPSQSINWVDDPSSACRRAVAQATAASAAAVVACLDGGLDCITAIAVAAVSIANAANICSDV